MAADNGVQVKQGASAPVNTGAGATSTAPAGSTVAQPKSIMDLARMLPSSSSLSKEGENYAETAAEIIRKSGRDCKVIPVTGQNYEARVLQVGNYHLTLIFDETYTNTGMQTLPTAVVAEDIAKQLAAKGIKSTSLLPLVVSKDDYEKLDTACTAFLGLFMSHDTPEFKNLSIQQFANDSFRISEDITDVRKFVELRNPLKTTPRCDCGILVYHTTKESGLFATQSGGKPAQGSEPLFAVTAYTEFISPNGGFGTMAPQKVTPVITITGVWSRLMNPVIGILGICAATEVLINNRGWLKPFSTYTKDGRDIGNLFRDRETGKMVSCPDQNSRNEAVANLMTEPLLALDIQLGNWSIPGLRDIFANQLALSKSVDAFSGSNSATTAYTELLNHGLSVIQKQVIRYDGDVLLPGSKTGDMTDTREVDFLHLVSRTGNPDTVAQFRQVYPDRPDLQVADLLNIYDRAKIKFVTYRAYLHPNWIAAIAASLGKGIHFQTDGSAAPAMLNIGTIAGFSNTGFGGGFVSNPVLSGISSASGLTW